jgi:hypothetical protein
VLDIYSRYVVGWMIAEVESSGLARQLIAASALKQDIQPDQRTLSFPTYRSSCFRFSQPSAIMKNSVFLIFVLHNL